VHAVMAAAMGLGGRAAFVGPPPVVEAEGKNMLFIEPPENLIAPLNPLPPPVDPGFYSNSPTSTGPTRIERPGPNPRREVQRGSSRKPALNKAARKMARYARAMRVEHPSGMRR
jgi:hypothetical protein